MLLVGHQNVRRQTAQNSAPHLQVTHITYHGASLTNICFSFFKKIKTTRPSQLDSLYWKWEAGIPVLNRYESLEPLREQMNTTAHLFTWPHKLHAVKTLWSNKRSCNVCWPPYILAHLFVQWSLSLAILTADFHNIDNFHRRYKEFIGAIWRGLVPRNNFAKVLGNFDISILRKKSQVVTSVFNLHACHFGHESVYCLVNCLMLI